MKEKMTLARALRHKKRVIEQIRKLDSDIQTSNSLVVGTEIEVDIRKCLESRDHWVSHLVDLKLKIQDATRPIMQSVLELAECKTEIALWQRLNTTHGKLADRFSAQTVEMNAVIRRSEQDRYVKIIQNRIDELQNRIDAFNAETVIEIFVPE